MTQCAGLGFFTLTLVLLLGWGLSPSSSAPAYGDDALTYDQRQNGTENLRVHMKDVTLVVAPAEVLVGLMDSLISTSGSSATPKHADQPPQRAQARLSHFLSGLLNRPSSSQPGN